MDQSILICCFCLSDSNIPLTDLFFKSKDGLTHFEKISSTLNQLTDFLKENANVEYNLCDKCCDTIDMVYQFNQSCLHNAKIYLSQKRIVKVEPAIKKFNTIASNIKSKRLYVENENVIVKTETCPESNFKANNLVEGSTLSETDAVKYVAEDVSNLENNSRVDVKTGKRKRKKPQSPKSKNKINRGIKNSLLPNIDYKEEKIIKRASRKLELENNLREDISADSDFSQSKQRQSSVLETTKIIYIRNGKKEFDCVDCSKTFTSRRDVERHYIIHSGVKSYCCKICGKSFGRKDSLNVHILIHNSDDTLSQKYTCEICGKTFPHKGNLNIHLRIHLGIKNFKCDICEKLFYQKSQLNKHLEVHSDSKPTISFICDICGKPFKQKSSMVKHIRTHTGDKPYKCESCDMAFTHPSALKKHKLTHSGEKPYSCDECGQRFRQKGVLIAHKRIHSGEKPFKCDLCEQAFTYQSHVVRHRLLHTGERPYACEICTKAFHRKEHLNKHKKIFKHYV